MHDVGAVTHRLMLRNVGVHLVDDPDPISAQRPEGVPFSFPFLNFPWHHSENKPSAFPADAIL